MRYFHTGYSHAKGFGSAYFECAEFPNRKLIIEILTTKEIDIIILSILEFKNKKEFESFKK